VLICPDSYKGTLSALQAAQAIERGVRAAWPEADIILRPLADGGEGTLEALLARGGERRSAMVQDPLGRPVAAEWGILADGTAVVEMAQASGLTLLLESERDPRAASSYGTGQLLREAIGAGCQRILVTIGGSATNDGGAGAMQALGARFLDAGEREIPRGGLALSGLARIDLARWEGREGLSVSVACDVDNPLCGPDGATHVYGPQKGASPGMAAELEAAMLNYGRVLDEAFGSPISDRPGAGAAGGMGAALMAFLGAVIRPGIDVVMDAVGFDEAVRRAGLVLTGEGKLDAQSLRGKTISGVLRRRQGKPVMILPGRSELPAAELGALAREGVLVCPPDEALARSAGDYALRLELQTRLALLSYG
jgi:glycerate kinase